jgi:hypothetical protein
MQDSSDALSGLRSNAVDVLTAMTLPIKRRATSSPYVSPTPSPSKKIPVIGNSKRERRRANREAKRRRKILDPMTCAESGRLGQVELSFKEALATSVGIDTKSPVVASTKKRRRREGRKSRCEREMLKAAVDHEQGGYAETYVKQAIPMEIETNFKQSRVASTGYTGLDDNIRNRSDIPLIDLISGKAVGRKFTLCKWDAKSVYLLSYCTISFNSAVTRHGALEIAEMSRM